MTGPRKIGLEEFYAEADAQGVEREDKAFVCPRCGVVQSARDLIAVGAGADFEAVRKYLGFSCIGRWTNAGPARKVPDGKPCDWTLGGLFRLHRLEVTDDEGAVHPLFELATPEQAVAHRDERLAAEKAS